MDLAASAAAWFPGGEAWTIAVAGGFAAGCMAGSFLTVVAHRVPRGETVVFGRSRCPACRATIRARDNVPVLGWLLVGGRCRACGTTISAQYPLIEVGCGCLLALLAAAELAAAGNGDPRTSAVAWCGRAALGLTLVAWSLLAADGHDVAPTTVGSAVLAAALLAVLVPALSPLGVACPHTAVAMPDTCLGRIVATGMGLMAGWAAGAAAGRPSRAACGLVGAALGWQAALLAAMLAVLGVGASRRAWVGGLMATTAVLCWHPLARAWAGACHVLTGGS